MNVKIGKFTITAVRHGLSKLIPELERSYTRNNAPKSGDTLKNAVSIATVAI